MDRIEHKLKASTMMEVMVAMLLISIALLLSFKTFTMVLQSNKSHQRLSATIAADQIFSETVKTNNYIDEEYTSGNFNIVKELNSYNDMKSLKELRIKVTDTEGKILYQRRQLIIVP